MKLQKAMGLFLFSSCLNAFAIEEVVVTGTRDSGGSVSMDLYSVGAFTAPPAPSPSYNGGSYYPPEYRTAMAEASRQEYEAKKKACADNDYPTAWEFCAAFKALADAERTVEEVVVTGERISNPTSVTVEIPTINEVSAIEINNAFAYNTQTSGTSSSSSNTSQENSCTSGEMNVYLEQVARFQKMQTNLTLTYASKIGQCANLAESITESVNTGGSLRGSISGSYTRTVTYSPRASCISSADSWKMGAEAAIIAEKQTVNTQMRNAGCPQL